MESVFYKKNKYFKKTIFRILNKKNITDLLLLYKTTTVYVHNSFLVPYKRYNSFFFISSPQRQLYYILYNLQTNKQINYSSACFLKLFTNSAKYYKKSHRNIGPITMHFRKMYKNLLKKIFFFKINNYTFKHQVF